MANNYKTVMQKAGVLFQKSFDWDYAISQDYLVNNPPVLLSELRLALRYPVFGRTRTTFKNRKKCFRTTYLNIIHSLIILNKSDYTKLLAYLMSHFLNLS